MDLPDAIDYIRPSVVQISAHFDVLGTGFLVTEHGLVITARHVTKGVPRDALNAAFTLPNFENFRSNFQHIDVTVLEEDPRHDLSLLRLETNPFPDGLQSGVQVEGYPLRIPVRAATLNEDRPREGTAIATSGYPLGEPTLVTHTGYVASAWAEDNLADSYLADLRANPGNSGGPVYRVEDGAIIGVCVAGKQTHIVDQLQTPVVLPSGQYLLANARITVVVPVRYVLELLGRHGFAQVSVLIAIAFYLGEGPLRSLIA